MDAPFATIQKGLDACTANKDDYVILMPSSTDYDITATLTMSTARVHLVCPTGIGWGGITGNTVRIHQNTAATATITVSADNIEIAGIFFKGDATQTTGNIITFSGTRWCANVHDNFFGMYATALTANYGIYAAGAMNHFAIYNNYFTNYQPGLNTGTNNNIAAFIGITSGSSTRGIIRNNIFLTGVNTTVAAAIADASTGSIIMDNIIYQSVANGGNDAGVLTLGVSSGVDSLCLRNAICIDHGSVANAFSGQTSNQGLILNYEPQVGGTLIAS
jgi:hypothetical protein